jgi:hypothetical protein
MYALRHLPPCRCLTIPAGSQESKQAYRRCYHNADGRRVSEWGPVSS